MPTMQVGGPAPPSGPSGIPTKVLLIGGGALLVGFLVWKTSSGGAAAARPATDGGTSVAGALTGLQQDAKVQYGDLTKTLQGLSTHLDAQAQALSDQGSQYAAQDAQRASWSDASLFQMLDSITRQLQGLPSPGGPVNPDFAVIGQPTMPGS